MADPTVSRRRRGRFGTADTNASKQGGKGVGDADSSLTKADLLGRDLGFVEKRRDRMKKPLLESEGRMMIELRRSDG